MAAKDILATCFECLSININYCKHGSVVDTSSRLYTISAVLRSPSTQFEDV